MPHSDGVRIFRTAPYIRATQKLFSEEALRAAEAEIAADPDRWPVMPRTGGCRKARVATGGTGQEWRRADDLLLP